MKKQITIILAVVLMLTLLSTPVLAYNEYQADNCIKDELPEELREKFMEIIAQFRIQMELIREKMHAYRDSEEKDAFQSHKDLRDELKVERYEALVEILPEDLAERFSERGRGLHHFVRENKFGNHRERTRQ